MTKYRRARARLKRDKTIREQKRHEKYAENDNFFSVISTQHFIEALIKCRKGVRWKGSVQIYSMNAITEISCARGKLLSHYLPELASIKRIELYERGKKRVIVPITIKDRMIQRVLCDYALVPVLQDTLIYDNGASMKGKGVEFTRARMMHHITDAIKEYGHNFYALTFDFKSFFDSIPHSTCQKILDENFADENIKWVVMEIIRSYHKQAIKHVKDESEKEAKLKLLAENQMRGICLGSQISQIMALAVPSKLDHYIKDKCGFKHYIRYMDDGVILFNDKQRLHELYDEMIEVCKNLGLTFNAKKTRILKISRGFTFLKVRYRITKSGKIVRTLAKSGIVRMRRKMKKFRHLVDEGNMTMDDVYNSVQSWVAHSYVANSYHSRCNMMRLYNRLYDGYRITKKYNHVKGGKNGELLQIDKWQQFRWSCDAA